MTDDQRYAALTLIRETVLSRNISIHRVTMESGVGLLCPKFLLDPGACQLTDAQIDKMLTYLGLNG